MPFRVSSGSLRCGMGWHDPDPFARWNHGYYFTRCRRCRSDLVRTAYSRWRVPSGYRVVWRTLAPETVQMEPVAQAATAPLAKVPAPAAESSAVLPISELLRHLDQSPSAGPDEAPPEAAQAPVPAAFSSNIPDFMDDPEPAPPARPGGRSPETLAAASGASPERTEQDGPSSDEPRKSEAKGRPNARSSLTADERAIRSSYVASLVVGLALLVILVQIATRLGPSASREVANAGLPAPAYAGFVTATVLNCRSAPAAGAAPVKRLLRGESVLFLSHQADWTEIAHEGGQCWALSRYLSASQPT